jgi:hypothetical protein
LTQLSSGDEPRETAPPLPVGRGGAVCDSRSLQAPPQGSRSARQSSCPASRCPASASWSLVPAEARWPAAGWMLPSWSAAVLSRALPSAASWPAAGWWAAARRPRRRPALRAVVAPLGRAEVRSRHGLPHGEALGADGHLGRQSLAVGLVAQQRVRALRPAGPDHDQHARAADDGVALERRVEPARQLDHRVGRGIP